MAYQYGTGKYGLNQWGQLQAAPGPNTYGDANYGDFLYGGNLDRLPHFAIEVFVNNAWVDVTCDVRTLSINMGRSNLLDAFAAATSTLDLADFEDLYNAWNP